MGTSANMTGSDDWRGSDRRLSGRRRLFNRRKIVKSVAVERRRTPDRRTRFDRRLYGPATVWTAEHVADLVRAFRVIEHRARETTNLKNGTAPPAAEPTPDVIPISTAQDPLGSLAPNTPHLAHDFEPELGVAPPAPRPEPVADAAAEPDQAEGTDAPARAVDLPPEYDVGNGPLRIPDIQRRVEYKGLEEISFEYSGKRYVLVDRSTLVSTVDSRESGMWCVISDGVMQGNFPAVDGEDTETLKEKALDIARRSDEFVAAVVDRRAPDRTEADRRQLKRRSVQRRQVLSRVSSEQRVSTDRRSPRERRVGDRIMGWLRAILMSPFG